MGRRYEFELFYPAARIADGVFALDRRGPSFYRKRRGQLVRYLEPLAEPPILSTLTPDTPIFCSTSILFPADEHVRTYHGDDWDEHLEWDDEGNEYLAVGSIDVSIRTGNEYALLSCAARTSWMSDLFERSPAVWQEFEAILRESGGRVGIFSGRNAHSAPFGRTARYPVLPDGVNAVELNFFDYVLEERPTYWHLDVDRFATDVLRAVGEV